MIALVCDCIVAFALLVQIIEIARKRNFSSIKVTIPMVNIMTNVGYILLLMSAIIRGVAEVYILAFI
jgi:uncharacterized protein with PQ loop repeat